MRILFLVFVVVVVGAAILFFQGGNQEVSPSPAPALTFQERDIASELHAVLLQSGERGSIKRILVCAQRRCDTMPWPRNISSDAVTDGQTWYTYRDDNLVKQPAGSNQPEVVVTKNPLVAPRGAFLSPDGKNLAYFLDNVHDEKKELTELWLYDEIEKGTRLLVENIVRPDALTSPRWNSAGTHLWYVADSGKKDEKKIEFIVVNIHPAQAAARFANIQWQLHQEAASKGIMDVSFTGRSAAFAEPISGGRTQITVIHEGSSRQAAIVRGHIPYVQWLEDGSLMYVVAGDSDFSFWRLRSTVHSLLARQSGEFSAARSDAAGEYVFFVRQESERYILSSLHVESGASEVVMEVPSFGDLVQIVHLERRAPDTSPQTHDTTISGPLRDDELAAFIDRHVHEITSEPIATPIRLITTNQTNVIFVDYRISNGQERRLLLTVRDAIHPEWSIRARYEPAGGEWHKVQGGGLSDPAPKNIYEWEESLNQWILKSSAK